SGGGSGGSIWLTGLTLSGAGSIAANGGSGEPIHGGGGGGGRISWEVTASSFTGVTTAYGGAGANVGGAGTVYTELQGQNGQLVVDNGGRQGGTNTTLTITDNSLDLLVRGNAGVVAPGAWTLDSLTLASNGFLFALPGASLSINASSSITIEPSSAILAIGAGSGPGLGSGAGRSFNDNVHWPCGGGGYGGYGASGSFSNAVGGPTYGSQQSPSSTLGSGGGSYLPYSLGG